MASSSPNQSQLELRLLLDQGFPRPRGFDPSEVDRTIVVRHLSEFDPELSRTTTPDWAIYCRAAEAGFAALVTRDRAQLEDSISMFVLSRLSRFAVLTWRQPVEDPIREWGQLLAYLPEVRRLLAQHRQGIVFLPAPKLGEGSFETATNRLGQASRSRGVSQQQLRGEARQEIRQWSVQRFGDARRFDELLGLRARRVGPRRATSLRVGCRPRPASPRFNSDRTGRREPVTLITVNLRPGVLVASTAVIAAMALSGSGSRERVIRESDAVGSVAPSAGSSASDVAELNRVPAGFRCPASWPALRAPAGHATSLAPGPIAARVCSFGAKPITGSAPPVGGLPLGSGPAGAVVSILDASPSAPPAALRCAIDNTLPRAGASGSKSAPDALVVFFYRDGATVPLVDVSNGLLCSHAVAFIPGGAQLVDPTLSLFLLGWSMDDDFYSRLDPAPDLYGQSAAAAARIAARTGATAMFGGEEFDTAVPEGVVLLQDPAAGDGDANDDRQIEVVIATHPGPPCTPNELRLEYEGGGLGVGNDFGTIVLRDVGSTACAVTGPIGVAGLDERGRVDTTEIHDAVQAPLVLTPDAQSPAAGPVPIAEVVAELVLVAHYRDDPVTGGLCVHIVVPASWRLDLPTGAMTVANASKPANHPAQVPRLMTCRGVLGVFGPVTAH